MDKNRSIAKRTFKKYLIEEDFYLLQFQNESKDLQEFQKTTKKENLQFHFCLKGGVHFLYHNRQYERPLEKERSMVLYNPKDELPLHVALAPNSILISLFLPIEKMHAFFSKEAHFIAFLNRENRDKKYYREYAIAPNLITVLNQVINHTPNAIVARLYYRSKALELLSLYFNGPKDIDLDQCPFLADEKNVIKIKQAKEIMISRLAAPPTLQELANEIQLPLNSLKKGFKQVYGNTVYGFLLDYKMERSRQLLQEGIFNVNEVGLKMGYSAASHFIAAFKKKYGTTPKRYLMEVSKPSV